MSNNGQPTPQPNPQDLADWKAARDYRKAGERGMSQLDGIAQALAELSCPAPHIVGMGHLGWCLPNPDENLRDEDGKRKFHFVYPRSAKTIAAVMVHVDRCTFHGVLYPPGSVRAAKFVDLDLTSDPATVRAFAEQLKAWLRDAPAAYAEHESRQPKLRTASEF